MPSEFSFGRLSPCTVTVADPGVCEFSIASCASAKLSLTWDVEGGVTECANCSGVYREVSFRTWLRYASLDSATRTNSRLQT